MLNEDQSWQISIRFWNGRRFYFYKSKIIMNYYYYYCLDSPLCWIRCVTEAWVQHRGIGFHYYGAQLNSFAVELNPSIHRLAKYCSDNTFGILSISFFSLFCFVLWLRWVSHTSSLFAYVLWVWLSDTTGVIRIIMAIRMYACAST